MLSDRTSSLRTALASIRPDVDCTPTSRTLPWRRYLPTAEKKTIQRVREGRQNARGRGSCCGCHGSKVVFCNLLKLACGTYFLGLPRVPSKTSNLSNFKTAKQRYSSALHTVLLVVLEHTSTFLAVAICTFFSCFTNFAFPFHTSAYFSFGTITLIIIHILILVSRCVS